MAPSHQIEQAGIVEFKGEYQAKTCATCKGEKWPASPFCRKCSIKLQRMHLMQWLHLPFTDRWKHGNDVSKWPPAILAAYHFHYDRARDYLLCRARGL